MDRRNLSIAVLMTLVAACSGTLGGDGDADADGDADGDGDNDGDADSDPRIHLHFDFPEAWDHVGVFADQIYVPALSEAQLAFVATHFVGTQKLTVEQWDALRAYNPAFIVLHYHLGIWQQDPSDSFIVDGSTWGNDFDEVTTHDAWFWTNQSGERVRSSNDGKYLMNISDAGMQEYWRTTILEQISAGSYDGVFLDSSSPPLLTGEAIGGELDGEQMPGDDRFREMGILQPFAELGGVGWPEAYASFMDELCTFLETNGVACIPNVGNHITTWDTTDYFTTSTGGMIENAWMGASPADWVQVADRILRMGDGIIILQSYLGADDDVTQRMFYLGCYLLVKDRYTYVTYFTDDPFTWFPEYDLDLGAPVSSPTSSDITTLAWSGLFRRDFERGFVLVNPTDGAVSVDLDGEFMNVVPTGDGMVGEDGAVSGELVRTAVSSLELPPWSAAVLQPR
jgi:hypothetical protein